MKPKRSKPDQRPKARALRAKPETRTDQLISWMRELLGDVVACGYLIEIVEQDTETIRIKLYSEKAVYDWFGRLPPKKQPENKPRGDFGEIKCLRKPKNGDPAFLIHAGRWRRPVARRIIWAIAALELVEAPPGKRLADRGLDRKDAHI